MPQISPSIAKRSAIAVAWNYAGAIARVFSQLGIQVVLARVLGPEVFGQYAVLLAVLGVGWLVADGGFGAALIQKKEIDNQDIAYAFTWVFLLGFAICLMVNASAGFLASWIGAENLVWPLRAVGILILLQALSNVPFSLMKRELQAKNLQIIQVGGYAVAFGVFGIGGAYLGLGLWSLIISFFVQTLISLTATYCLKPFPFAFSFKGDRDIKKFGMAVVGTNVANWAIDNLDRVIVVKIWGAVAGGAYSVAANLSKAPAGIFVNAIQSVVFASGSKIKDDLPALRATYLLLVNLSAIFTFPFFFFLSGNAKLILLAFYGHKWEAATPLFAAFLVAIPFYILVAVTGPLLWAIGSVRLEMRVQVAVGALIVAGYLALSRYSLDFAVWIIPVAYFIRATLITFSFCSSVGISTRQLFGRLIGPVSMGLVFFFFGSIVRELIGASGWVSCCVSLAFCSIFFIIIVRVFPARILDSTACDFIRSKAAKNFYFFWLAKILNI